MILAWARGLAIVTSLVAVVLTSAPAQGKRPLCWILNGHAMTTFSTDPAAQAFFANAHPFVVITKKWHDVSVPASWGAVPTQIFTSDAEFESAIAGRTIASDVKAVLYDNEMWPLTPQGEQQNFAQYAERFYKLAHEHGYTVIQTPAFALAKHLQANGERRFPSFIRQNFMANAAKFSDVVDIEAQDKQIPPSAFAKYVIAAAQQAHQANPNVLVFAGISTNPSGHEVTTDQIVAAINATRNVVDGYWFNVPEQGPFCSASCHDYRPDMAVDVLRALRAQGIH